MLVHLTEVGSDWFVFGIALGMPISKLRSIEVSYLKEGVKRCIVEMLQYILVGHHPSSLLAASDHSSGTS